MRAAGQFLVMGLNGLILQDVLGTISDAFPAWRPCTAGDEAAAIEQVLAVSDWRCAFLNMGPDELAASRLLGLLKSAGAQIVLMGSAAEDAGSDSPYPVLMRPFMAEDVLSALSLVHDA